MKFYVEGTDIRPKNNKYYVSQMNSDNYKRFGKYIVIELLRKQGNMRIIAENYPLAGVKGNIICIDQSIRSGLGIERNNDELKGYSDYVTVHRLHIPIIKRICNTLAEPFGYRYLVMRFNRPRVADAEKNIVRATNDSFSLLGIGNNDHLILEYPVKENNRYVLRSVSVEGLITDESYDNKLPKDISELDNGNDDLPKIYVDYEVAKHIYLPSILPLDNRPTYIDLQPILVRRDTFRILLKYIMQFSTGVFMTIIGLTNLLNVDLVSSSLVIIISIFISLCITVIKIRSTL